MSFKLKIVAGFVGLAMVIGAVGVATPTNAQTVEELQALINQLMQQIAALQGGGSSSGSTACTFTRSLTLGSSGADVTCLQNYLMSTGHFTFAGGATGYFGPVTRSAVAAWQAANGVAPAAGFWGPVSQARYNQMAATVPPVTGGLPQGCTSTSGFSPITGQRCDGTTTPPTTTLTGDGSITIASSALVSSGTQVKKGETRNVLSTRLKATSAPVRVDRVEVKFNERPWLTMNQIQLKDGSGNVLATKTLSGASDTTEVTVGSDYRVRFDNVNLVVSPSTDVDLVVAVSVLASSDKITGQTITISVPASGIRTVNGIGFSETIGPSAEFTFTLPTTGSQADIYTAISPNSPLAGFQRIAAGTTQTENVVLGVFRIKSQNTGATLNNINFTFETGGGPAATQIFNNVRLRSGNFNYGASTFATTTEFTNLEVPLPLDQWIEFTLTANVVGAGASPSSSGVSASTTLVKSSISGIDTNFNTLTVSNASDITSEDLTFLEAGVGISNSSATVGNCFPETPTTCAATFTFTLTNTGNNIVYVSKEPATIFATSSVPAQTGNATSSITTILTNPSNVAGDTADSFAIQSGASRTFTANGALHKDTAGTTQLKITGIYFGSSATAGVQGTSGNAANSLTTGLGNLVATTVF